MSMPQEIRTAQSCALDPREAVREFHAGVACADTVLVVFFCSIEYDLDTVADEMRRMFAGIPVVGCTTAGEIGPAGYRGKSLAGAGFPSGTCTAVTGHLDGLRNFEIARGQVFAHSLLQRLEIQAPGTDAHNSFAFLLIDGMSVREEPVTRSLQNALGRIPMFGGSAGDDLKFSSTQVFHEGCFHRDSAVLILATTTLPFRIFKTQHFVSTEERMVVTEADAENRIVREINGLPAAQEYARIMGVDVNDLDPMRFAASPVVVLIDGVDYVRAIQKANPDGSLTFYCAIEEGLVLRVARGVDLVENLQHAFQRVVSEIGHPQVVFGCDCILRHLEMSQCGLKDRVAAVLRDYNTVGFNTYGEQFAGVHVNQTFTAIAIGHSRKSADE
ncbi:nitric oxide-sensing protein NosP [Noviherbaspirillum sp. ST9]|uniref:nitric oxide-sensing protein NosP n=1 Tax=Noviherbaspirillum sp. ST9 TaxID=3401606 RepID=UPI003B588162